MTKILLFVHCNTIAIQDNKKKWITLLNFSSGPLWVARKMDPYNIAYCIIRNPGIWQIQLSFPLLLLYIILQLKVQSLPTIFPTNKISKDRPVPLYEVISIFITNHPLEASKCSQPSTPRAPLESMFSRQRIAFPHPGRHATLTRYVNFSGMLMQPIDVTTTGELHGYGVVVRRKMSFKGQRATTPSRYCFPALFPASSIGKVANEGNVAVPLRRPFAVFRCGSVERFVSERF